MRFFKRFMSLFGNKQKTTSQNTASHKKSLNSAGQDQEKKILIEPKWSICSVGNKRIPPSDHRHVDHQLWRRWRRDVRQFENESVSRANEELSVMANDKSLPASASTAAVFEDAPEAELDATLVKSEDFEHVEFESAIQAPVISITAIDPEEQAKKLDDQRRRREEYIRQQQDAETRNLQDKKIQDEVDARNILAKQRLRQESIELAIAGINAENAIIDYGSVTIDAMHPKWNPDPIELTPADIVLAPIGQYSNLKT
jgi:hypothetical protein